MDAPPSRAASHARNFLGAGGPLTNPFKTMAELREKIKGMHGVVVHAAAQEGARDDPVMLAYHERARSQLFYYCNVLASHGVLCDFGCAGVLALPGHGCSAKRCLLSGDDLPLPQSYVAGQPDCSKRTPAPWAWMPRLPQIGLAREADALYLACCADPVWAVDKYTKVHAQLAYALDVKRFFGIKAADYAHSHEFMAAEVRYYELATADQRRALVCIRDALMSIGISVPDCVAYAGRFCRCGNGFPGGAVLGPLLPLSTLQTLAPLYDAHALLDHVPLENDVDRISIQRLGGALSPGMTDEEFLRRMRYAASVAFPWSVPESVAAAVSVQEPVAMPPPAADRLMDEAFASYPYPAAAAAAPFIDDSEDPFPEYVKPRRKTEAEKLVALSSGVAFYYPPQAGAPAPAGEKRKRS